MNTERFRQLTEKYPRLRVAVVGDFCLDRYLEIDPAKQETSIETGLPVHNVVCVRSQPGGAGTILNNLVALGIGEILPVGFCGEDGEGYELLRALKALRGVNLDHFTPTADRRTFTYCKPLVVEAGKPPVELSRLDSKNWTDTPPALEQRLAAAVQTLAGRADAMIILEQVDRAGTGVVTSAVLEAVRSIATSQPGRFVVADSRRGLRGYPPVCLKMNLAELGSLTSAFDPASLPAVEAAACQLARTHGRPVFVTLAERGILGAEPNGGAVRVPALPLRGEIDIVGAGDAVTANLAAAYAADASMPEALALANTAASIVIHQLGTTGTAGVEQIRKLMFG